MAAATTTIESSTPCSEGLGFDSTQTVPPTPSTVSEDTPMEHDAAAESERVKDNVPRLSTEHEEKRESTTLQPLPGPAITEVSKPRSSRFRGVCWNKKNRRWQSAINNSGKYIYLGSFTSDIDAARAFDLAALQIRGRNTKLNFRVEDYPEADWKSGAPPHLVEKYTSGTIRSKPLPYRNFTPNTNQPLKKLFPGNYATIQLPIKRSRCEGPRYVKPNFELSEPSFRNSVYLPAASVNQPKIKQEFPQVLGAPTSAGKIDTLQTPFRTAPSSYLHNRPGVARPSLPNGGDLLRGDQREMESGKYNLETPTTPSMPYVAMQSNTGYGLVDDSAKPKEGKAPSSANAPFVQTPVPQLIRPTPNPDRIPVPRLHPSKEDSMLQLNPITPETLPGGNEIEEAKVIVGSSRNQFGLIHCTAVNSRWNALVYDGNTMHSMGVYSSKEDAQVACTSAVRLVETIMTRNTHGH